MAAMLRNTTVNERSCAAASNDPSLLATDLADYLVKKGVPFRKAHHLVGSGVAKAESEGRGLNELTVADWQRIDAAFEDDVAAVFDLKGAMNRRNITGAPGAREVRRQLSRWRKQLGGGHGE
jgi:argininosuccinate lyase